MASSDQNGSPPRTVIVTFDLSGSPRKEVFRGAEAHMLSTDASRDSLKDVCKFDKKIAAAKEELEKEHAKARPCIEEFRQMESFPVNTHYQLQNFFHLINYLIENGLPMWKGQVVVGGTYKGYLKAQLKEFLGGNKESYKNVKVVLA